MNYIGAAFGEALYNQSTLNRLTQVSFDYCGADCGPVHAHKHSASCVLVASLCLCPLRVYFCKNPSFPLRDSVKHIACF